MAAALLATPVAWLDRERPRPDLPPATQEPPADAPDVLVVLIDTLRADAVPPEGAIAELASGGARFEQCVSAAPWTLPSVSSLLTSLLPAQHGATEATTPLPEDNLTLPEVLRDAGYQTAAFTGGAFLGSTFQLDQGFEHFDPTPEFRFRPFRLYVPIAWRIAKNRYLPLRPVVRWVREYAGSAGLRDAARSWLARRDPARPCFLLVHSYEVHDYYLYHPDPDDGVAAPGAGPSGRFRRRLSVHPEELWKAKQSDLDWFRGIYAARVASVDAVVGELAAAFSEASERDVVLAIASDHGEGFDAARRRVHHGGRLHEDLLRVPLILHAPGRVPAGVRVAEQVRTIDLMPTLLELIGLSVPPRPDRRLAPPRDRGHAERSAPLLEPGARPRSGEGRPPRPELEADRRRDAGSAPTTSRATPGRTMATPPRRRISSSGLRSFGELHPARAAARASVDEQTLEHLKRLGYVD